MKIVEDDFTLNQTLVREEDSISSRSLPVVFHKTSDYIVSYSEMDELNQRMLDQSNLGASREVGYSLDQQASIVQMYARQSVIQVAKVKTRRTNDVWGLDASESSNLDA